MGRVKTAAEIDEQIAQLKAQKQALLQRERADERKKRNHALMVLGGMVEKYYGGGDWKTLDPVALDKYMSKFAYKGQELCMGEPLDPREANARIRAFEKNGR